MLKFTQQIYDELLTELELLRPDASSKEILKVFQTWIIKYSQVLSYPPFNDYKLAEQARMDADEYPVEYSSLHDDEFTHIKKVLNRYNFRDKKSISRVLGEVLDKLYFFEVDEVCPNCQRSGLLVWKKIEDAQLVFECVQCAFLGTLDGYAVKNVIPPTTMDLTEAYPYLKDFNNTVKKHTETSIELEKSLITKIKSR